LTCVAARTSIYLENIEEWKQRWRAMCRKFDDFGLRNFGLRIEIRRHAAGFLKSESHPEIRIMPLPPHIPRMAVPLAVVILLPCR